MALISSLDHLVIVAESLEQGVDYCERMLGVRPLKGGSHARMATHNHLLNLGDGIYLEVIAIDPTATPPKRSRWFGMDARGPGEPRLTTFVVRTNNIILAANALPSLGTVTDMARDTLQWQITIRDDGALVDEGTVPALIQWPDGVDPTAAMPDLGCRLLELEIFHPDPATLISAWDCIGLHADHRILIKPCSKTDGPHFVARFETPSGIKTLS